MGNRLLVGESKVPRTTAVAVVAAALVSTAGTGVALGQPAITIEIEEPVLLPGESTTLTMFAGYGRGDYAVAGLITDLVTSVGSQGWSDADIVQPMDGPGTTPGMPSGTGYAGIIAGQLNFPGGAGIYADPTNPIAFWQATYTAPADVPSPFEVDLSTMTTRYEVFTASGSSSSESRLDELIEGAGTITVIPAPASFAVLALGVACVRRRR